MICVMAQNFISIKVAISCVHLLGKDCWREEGGSKSPLIAHILFGAKIR